MCAGLLFFQLLSYESCIKEYSYEGGPAGTVDTIPVIDTLSNDSTDTSAPIVFPYCSACNGQSGYILGTWNFKYDTSFFCGNITRSIINVDKNAFTFFGPSACSLDTGLIMSVYLDNPLIEDAENITASRAYLQYYNNKGIQNIFDSSDSIPITLTIEKYTLSTGVATGHFSGSAKTDRNTKVKIQEGKFMIQF
jgi:hypothetical protein